MAGLRVLLIDVDSTIPNLALMKISTYHKGRGDLVGFNISNPNIIYLSCIFKKNKELVNSQIKMLKTQYPNAIIDAGGVGFNIHKILPDCIENCKPDYDLYPECDYALGFTTRGCIRHCPFCIVHDKEGTLHRIQDISEIYDPRFKQIKLLDNNVLADKENFKRIAEFCIEHKLKIDLSQGLDIRLIDDECAALLAKMKCMVNWVFAFDSLRYKDKVLSGIECLRRNGVDVRSRIQFYVYCDKSDGEYGIKSAIERCNILRENKAGAWVMLNIDEEPTQQMKNLKRWTHRKQFYWTHTFEEYDFNHPGRGMSRAERKRLGIKAY